jgi:integrase
MIHVSFVLRDLESTKPTPVIMLVNYNGDRSKYSTGVKTLSKNFQQDNTKKNYQRLTSGDFHPISNRRLDDMEHRIKKLYFDLLDKLKRVPSHAELKEAFQNKQSVGFFEYADAFVERTKTKVNSRSGKKFAYAVPIQYKNTVKQLREYARKTNKRVDFNTITPDFLDGWISFLTNQNLAPATISKRIAQLKTIMRAAQDAGLHSNASYFRFKRPSSEADKIYLNKKEIAELYRLKLEGMQERIRDLFVVGCWTCLRYSDYNKIRREDVRKGVITVEHVKTGRTVNIPLHPFVKEILLKYDYQLPRYANQVMNRNLKVICQKVKSLNEKIPYR